MTWKLRGVTRLWGLSITDWKSWEGWNILQQSNDFHHMTNHFASIENHCSLADVSAFPRFESIQYNPL
jgi:hypothetical protein